MAPPSRPHLAGLREAKSGKASSRLAGGGTTGKEDRVMRVDYRTVFPDGVRAMAEMEWSVRSATMEPGLLELGLEGLDLPAAAGQPATSGGAA